MKNETNPKYYTIGIQPIEYIESWGFNYCEGNVLKYLTRWRRKDGVNDLKKAKWYLERMISKCKNWP